MKYDFETVSSNRLPVYNNAIFVANVLKCQNGRAKQNHKIYHNVPYLLVPCPQVADFALWAMYNGVPAMACIDS